MSQDRIPLLHSRYNPQGEAERYIASLVLNDKTRFFILIEPGLGYMVAPLKKKAPAAKIIALHAVEPRITEPGLAEQCFVKPNPAEQHGLEKPDSEWHPGTGVSVQDFLEQEIPDSEASEIQVLEWRPALAIYRGAYLGLVQEAAEFIKRTDANTRTLIAFGRRWFRNFFRNLEIIRQVLCPGRFSIPILVTGAGPGLEDLIPIIREEFRQAGIFILAVSSSAAALEANNVIPNMVISTDGGLWAAFHLYDYCRANNGSGGGGALPCPLAAALTAALPSQCGTLPVLPMSDGSLWQTLILKGLQIPFMVMPQRGTVSAAALDLAFALSDADIFIAGIDLANHDMRSHARPYSLDRFLEEKAGRFQPVYSQAYRRSSLLKAGGSYGIYAAWFEKQLAAYPKRLHSLGKNNPLFGSLETPSLKTVQGREHPAGSSVQFKIFTLEDRDKPSQKALAILEKGLKDPAHSVKLWEELASLLFPGRAAPSPDELTETLRSLAGWDRGSPLYG